MQNISTILEQLAQSEHLSPEMAQEAFASLFSGELTAAQAGALLLGLRIKGETAEEINAAVQAALGEARLVSGIEGKAIDTCGTGGDKKMTFNCSTAVAFYLAGMGYNVVKHGNRSVSSNCGSADVVEAMGLPFLEDKSEIMNQLLKSRFVFLFAPHFHPAFAKIAPIRKELGVRTLFNLLGPLLNPARPSHQLLGVARQKFVPLMAEALALSGIKRGAVVHGAGGYDELTPLGPSEVMFVQNGQCEPKVIDPASYGIETCREEDLVCASLSDSLSVMRLLLSGKGPQAMQGMIALNLGLALSLLEEDASLEECMQRAKHAVNQGVAEEIANAA
jgi:anthranilate phosphoribosyltransferase